MTSPSDGTAGVGQGRGGGAGPQPVTSRNAGPWRPVCLVLAAAGGALSLLASAQPWASGRAAPGPGLPDLPLTIAGGQAAPAVGALALVALAGTVALLATKGRLRQAVAVLLLVAGLGIAAAALAAGHDPTALLREAPTPAGLPPTGAREVSQVTGSVWPWVAVLAGALVAAAGVVAAVTASRWTGMSSRYERPVAAGGAQPAQRAEPAGPAGPAEPAEPAEPLQPAQPPARSGSADVARALPDNQAAREDLVARREWEALDAGLDPSE